MNKYLKTITNENNNTFFTIDASHSGFGTTEPGE